ncbi:HEPN domain-containing protein [Streptomyces sp. H021]|uniref:HEPN domain-containing protein n=1 Tax=Streptomyces sp. H021 TaxID=1519486 RepID=UPI000D1BBE3B
MPASGRPRIILDPCPAGHRPRPLQPPCSPKRNRWTSPKTRVTAVSSSTNSPSQGSTPSHHQLLLRVSKASKSTLTLYAEGIHLANTTARSLIDLQHQACADRILLAQTCLRAGDRLMRARPPEYRSAISRYYYAMYHAIRAVVYFHEGGDDKEAHSTLPKAVPSDFTDSAIWQNALKDARSTRNAADYDPYPMRSEDWRDAAKHLQGKAPALLTLAESYLKVKGCRHL